MKRHRRIQTRRGAVALEGAVVISLLLLMLFFTFDIGLAVVRYNLLSAAARTVARQAVVHGSAAPPELAEWGPAIVSGTAGDGNPLAEIAVPLLATMSPSDVAFHVDWPDGDNKAGKRVRVKLTYVHAPHVPFIDLAGTFTLRAESTMQIVH